MPSDRSNDDDTSGESAADDTDSRPDQRTRTDATDDRAADGDRTTSEASGAASTASSTDRDVVVPMRVYKAVTVFTTMFAVFAVVGGFVLLDTATNRAQASLSEVQPVVALVGVGLILAGAAAYAFSTRFRTAEMGKAKDDTDEASHDG